MNFETHLIELLTSPLEKEDVGRGLVADLVAGDLVLGDAAVVEVVPLAGGHVPAEGRVVAPAHRPVVVHGGVEVEERPPVRVRGRRRGGRREERAGQERRHVEAGEGKLHGLLEFEGVRVDVDEPVWGREQSAALDYERFLFSRVVSSSIPS